MLELPVDLPCAFQVGTDTGKQLMRAGKICQNSKVACFLMKYVFRTASLV
jgi:hypothetical protein